MKTKFKGTEGSWRNSTIGSETLEGVTSSKIYDISRKKIIGSVNSTHDEEGYANLKLIINAPEMFKVLEDILNDNTKAYSGDSYILEKEEMEAIRNIIEKITVDNGQYENRFNVFHFVMGCSNIFHLFVQIITEKLIEIRLTYIINLGRYKNKETSKEYNSIKNSEITLNQYRKMVQAWQKLQNIIENEIEPFT